MSFLSSRDEPTKFGGVTYLPLLGAFPAVRVSQDKLYVAFNGVPHETGMSFGDIFLGAFEQVSHEVTENFNRCFAIRQGWKISI